MNKLILILLLLVTFVLGGCGSNDSTKPESTLNNYLKLYKEQDFDTASNYIAKSGLDLIKSTKEEWIKARKDEAFQSLKLVDYQVQDSVDIDTQHKKVNALVKTNYQGKEDAKQMNFLLTKEGEAWKVDVSQVIKRTEYQTAK